VIILKDKGKQTFEVAKNAGGVLLRTTKLSKAEDWFLGLADKYPNEQIYLWTWNGHKRVGERIANKRNEA
jgi:hypothetical protein